MDSTSFLIKYLPVTDWIQSIGAFIAIIAGIWGIITLFRKDKDKEKQINSLIDLASETKKQTDIMIKQSINLETQVLNYREELDFKYQTRFSDIKPCFIKLSSHAGLIFQQIEIGNIGKGDALRPRIEIVNSKSSEFSNDIGAKKIIKKNETINISFPICEETNYFYGSLQYTDEDRNPLSQRFSYKDYQFTILLPQSELSHPQDPDES